MNQWFFNLAAIKIGEGILDTKTMSFAAKEVALVLFGLVALAVALTGRPAPMAAAIGSSIK